MAICLATPCHSTAQRLVVAATEKPFQHHERASSLTSALPTIRATMPLIRQPKSSPFVITFHGRYYNRLHDTASVAVTASCSGHVKCRSYLPGPARELRAGSVARPRPADRSVMTSAPSCTLENRWSVTKLSSLPYASMPL